MFKKLTVSSVDQAERHLHIGQFVESSLVFEKLHFPKHLKEPAEVKSVIRCKATFKPTLFYFQHPSVTHTHPGSMASAVVAFEQTVNERAAAALDQRVGVAQLHQPVPEAASSKRAGRAAYFLQRNP